MSQVEAGLRAPTFKQPHISLGFFLTCLEVFDILVVAGAGSVASWFRFGTWSFTGVHGIVVVLAVLVAYFAFRYTKLHDISLLPNPFAQARRAATAILLTGFVLLAVGYATKTSEDFSRLWLGTWFLGAYFILAVTRPAITLLYQRLERAGVFSRRFVIFATVSELDSLQKLLDRWPAIMHRSDTISGIFLDHPDRVASNKGFRAQHLVKGSIDDFLAWSANRRVDNAVAVMPAGSSLSIEPLLQKISSVSLDVDLVVGQVDEIWAQRDVSKVAGLPAIRVMRRSLDSSQFAVKRIEDIVVAGLALIFLGPLMLSVALAIKLDSAGPVFFRQARHGFNNRPFYVFKFRTMFHTPDVLSDVAQARRNDPRVTPLGAFLRKTSLDELPQLFNVLLGEMSIVGPRPHAVEHNDMYAQHIDAYLARHRIRPGITGWAQINGLRGETRALESMRKRVEYDQFYVDHWSLAFDIRIMLLTLPSLAHPNAY